MTSYNRHNELLSAMTAWVKQFRPDIKLYDQSQGYNYAKSRGPDSMQIDVYSNGVRHTDWQMRGKKDEVLWNKAEIRKGVVILTDTQGKRWSRPSARHNFVEMKPKRILTQASILKSRYRRALITIPRQIKKLEDAVAEQRLELPILDDEIQRLRNYLAQCTKAFEDAHSIRVKPYPYHQSITQFAIKYGKEKYEKTRDAFWEIRHISARIEDLEKRSRHIYRYVRSADYKIQQAKEKQAKLGHGRDPNKKLSWEK